MAQAQQNQPIDLDEYVTFTRCGKTFLTKEAAYKFFCPKYASMFNKIASDTMPFDAKLGASLNDIATVVKSRKTRKYILMRDKVAWSKELKKAIEKANKKLTAMEKMYDMLETEVDKRDFENTILARAEECQDRAERAGELRDKLIDDFRKGLDDD